MKMLPVRLSIAITLVSFLFTLTTSSTHELIQVDQQTSENRGDESDLSNRDDFDSINRELVSEEDANSNRFPNRNIGFVKFISFLHQSFRNGDATCVDKRPQDCEEWGKIGYCQHSKASYKSWMAENCPLTCKICKVAEESKEETCEPSKNKNAKDCKEWAKLGYCDHKSQRYRSWMNENCPNSCKKCKVEVEETCKNKRDTCDALFRFCTSRFRNYMLNWCPKTCNACKSSLPVSKSSGQSIQTGNSKNGSYDKSETQSSTSTNTLKSCYPVKCGILHTENRRKRNSDSPPQNLRPRITLKIVGGGRSMRGRWPWHGMLLKQVNGRVRFCGITIICKHWLVTAAHCVVANGEDFNITRERMNTFTVYVGRYEGPYGRSDDVTQEFGLEKLEKIVIHPYFRHSPYFAHDIALIKLTKNSPIQFTTFIQPICLPTTNDLAEGNILTTYGWGRTKGYGPSSEQLKEVNLPFVTHKQCRRRVWGLYDRGTLCAGGTRNTDSCTGDSGGSLVKRQTTTNSTQQDNRFYFYGITSYGSRSCNTRPPYNPGVYTDVSYYYNWIKQQTKQCCDDD